MKTASIRQSLTISEPETNETPSLETPIVLLLNSNKENMHDLKLPRFTYG